MSASPKLGLRENAAQFTLLVGLNALVGGMVGLERSVLPLIGEHNFKLTSTAATGTGDTRYPIPTLVEDD